MKVVADDADADHRKNRGHGSRILSDRDGQMTRASKQASKRTSVSVKAQKIPPKKGEKNTKRMRMKRMLRTIAVVMNM